MQIAKIIISELQRDDSESFLADLNDRDLISIYGGDDYALSQMLAYGMKFLEFGLIVFAIDSITRLLESFKTTYNTYYKG
jgi:hypothetical protein